VESWCGNGTTRICKLGTHTDAKHIVIVRNLRGYPADIKCYGKLDTANVLKFTSPPETEWFGQTQKPLPDKRTKPFDQGILPVSVGLDEIVHTEVHYDLPMPEINGIIELSFNVVP
jgi:hypothetical protein